MKRIFLGGLGACVLLLVMGALTFYAKSRWDVAATLNAIRETGDPVSTAEVQDQRNTAGVNATGQLRDLLKLGDAFCKKTDAILSGPNFSWDGKKVPVENLEALRLEVAANRELFDAFRLAARSDRYDYDGEISVDLNALSNSLQEQSKPIARLARHLTKSYAAMGDGEAALQLCLDHLNLFKIQEQPMYTMGLSMSIAVGQMALSDLNALLQECEFSDETRQRIDQELSSVKFEKRHTYALKSERALSIEMVQGFGLAMQLSGALGDAIEGQSKLFDKELELGVSDPFQVDPLANVSGGSFGPLVKQTIDGTRNSVCRMKATIRCLRVLNQVRAQVQKGESPELITIDSLELEPGLKMDPYDGNPIKIKFTDKGWLVYCVGPDRKDDGGLVDEEDVGVCPFVDEVQ